jgi:NAD(P)-dependent dehydrogenase (short-subunit alcohol dehydrogenase family)
MPFDQSLIELFNISGKTAVITGGSGVLCSHMALSLASMGVRIAILDRNPTNGQAVADQVNTTGGQAITIACDVLERTSLEQAARQVLDAFGRVDMLINGVGGNNKQATTSAEVSFFDLPSEALRSVVDLNLTSAILSSQVFGRIMADQKEGVIINISSMAAFQPLTRVVGYAAAKAAISNFTQWLAVYMAKEISPQIRVNAIAPGFFIGEQNRSLLLKTGTDELTPRGQAIINKTPMGRFGQPDDLTGTLLWLVSPASAFVTGLVVPVDGGFMASSGI